MWATWDSNNSHVVFLSMSQNHKCLNIHKHWKCMIHSDNYFFFKNKEENIYFFLIRYWPMYCPLKTCEIPNFYLIWYFVLGENQCGLFLSNMSALIKHSMFLKWESKSTVVNLNSLAVSLFILMKKDMCLILYCFKKYNKKNFNLAI